MRATKAVYRLLCQLPRALKSSPCSLRQASRTHSPRVKCPDVCELVWGASCPEVLLNTFVIYLINYVCQ